MSAAGFFVTGTDTGVGKTVAACALVRALRAKGIDAGAMKPVETGVDERGPLDGQALWEAAGGADALEDVCPLRFSLAATPSVAARLEGRAIDLERIDEAFERLCAQRAVVVVEGAGGLLAPLTDELDMADLALRWQLPAVLVARAALGTINHTRLSLEAAERRGLEVVGVVISHSSGPLAAGDLANLDDLRRRLGALLLGEIPPLGPGQLPAPDRLGLDPLLTRMR